MARPANCTRVVLSGALPGNEIWTTGFWMVNTGITSNAEAAALALVIAGTLNASDSSGAMRITIDHTFALGASWQRVNVYHYATGGNIATYAGEYDLPSPVVNTSSPTAPNQVSLVLSLRTNFSGRQNRGRMYLPATGITYASGGQISPSLAQTLTDGWATAFTDINASDAGKIVVVSAAGSAAHQVSLLKMDTKLDIQRRRSNRQTVNGVGQTTVTL